MNMIRLQLIYPEDKIKEPVICRVCKNFDVILNIRTAKVTAEVGILTVEMEGEEEEIERAIEYIRSAGVSVSPVEGDVMG